MTASLLRQARRCLPVLATALVAAAALAPAAQAAARTTVYSSGDLAAAIPDGGVLEQPLLVPDAGPLADVDVAVRLAHPRDGDLVLTLLAPDGTRVLLASRRGGTGDDFGAGAATCAGRPAIFDDEAPFRSDPIHLASPPFAGRHWPERLLGVLDGSEGQGTWTLRVRDARTGATGTLLCFELRVTRTDPTVVTRGAGDVEASLTYREHDGTVTDARLTIARAGVVLVDEPIADACSACFALFADPTPLTVRDLDADGEPEVILDTYSGGAHCCTSSHVFRYSPAEDGYVERRFDWGNLSYTIRDLDRDGRPELRSGDDRFAYAFSCYACSFFPPRIFRLEDGGLVDVTREFAGIVRRDANRLWRQYLRLRRDPESDLRGLLAAYAADRALLGELEAAWEQLLVSRARGELDGPQGWPAGNRYLKELRRFLEQTGYAR